MEYVVMLLVSLLLSCGSVSHVNKESIVEETDSASKADVIRVRDVRWGATVLDSLDLEYVMESIVYDTEKYDMLSGTSPIKCRSIVTAKQKSSHRGTEGMLEESKEEANIVMSAQKKQKKKREGDWSATETKQLSYFSSVLYGLALLILMAVLAYWVRSKYRQRV